MISSQLKYRLASKKVSRLSKENDPAQDQELNMRMAVILDNDNPELFRKFRELKEELKVKDVDFQIVLCKEEEYEAGEALSISPADFNWRGKIKRPEVEEFFKQSFDLLIAFTQVQTLFLELLLKGSAAGLSIGRKENAAEIYDLSISCRFEEVEVFQEEVKKYIKILNKTVV